MVGLRLGNSLPGKGLGALLPVASNEDHCQNCMTSAELAGTAESVVSSAVVAVFAVAPAVIDGGNSAVNDKPVGQYRMLQ